MLVYGSRIIITCLAGCALVIITHLSDNSGIAISTLLGGINRIVIT